MEDDISQPLMGPPAESTVLVTGLDGQDGYYLTRELLGRGCRVYGGAQNPASPAVTDLIDDLPGVEPVYLQLTDREAVDELIERIEPDVIYHLAAQSSVAVSWKEPVLTSQVNAMGTIYLLEAMRRFIPESRLVFAGSCDCFDHEAAGSNGVTPITPFKATNPYAVSKIMAHQMIRCYRQQHGLHASVAILFNHTSPRRPEMFVERGIVRQAVRVSLGLADKISVGSMETRRDWSWAPEVMAAFAALGGLEEPVDLVLGSGHTMTVGDWVNEACAQLGLDPQKQVKVDASKLHPGDRPNTHGNLDLAGELLGWEPQVGLTEMVAMLIEADREALSNEANGTNIRNVAS